MENLINELESKFGKQRIKVDEHLANVSPTLISHAGVFVSVNDAQELVDAVRIARKNNVPAALADIDSDLLEAEGRFNGLVLKNDARKLDIIARKGKIQNRQTVTDYALVEAESGVSFTRVVRFTIEEGLAGVEDGSGIKGSTGSLFIKEKEYVRELSQNGVLQTVKVLSEKGEVVEVQPGKLEDHLIVLSAVFKLVGEHKKILWLKAQKAAEKRGVREFSAI